MEINYKHHGFLGLIFISVAYYLFQKKLMSIRRRPTETGKQHWHDRELSERD